MTPTCATCRKWHPTGAKSPEYRVTTPDGRDVLSRVGLCRGGWRDGAETWADSPGSGCPTYQIAAREPLPPVVVEVGGQVAMFGASTC